MAQKVYEIEVDGRVFEVEADSIQSAAAAAKKFAAPAAPPTGPKPGILANAGRDVMENVLPGLAGMAQDAAAFIPNLLRIPVDAANALMGGPSILESPAIAKGAQAVEALPAAWEGIKEAVSDPVGTFEERPVSTALDLATVAAPVAGAVRGGGRMLYNIGARKQGLRLPTEEAIKRTLKAGFEKGINLNEAGSKRGQGIIAENTAAERAIEDLASGLGGPSITAGDFLTQVPGQAQRRASRLFSETEGATREAAELSNQAYNMQYLSGGGALTAREAGDMSRFFRDQAHAGYRAAQTPGGPGPVTDAERLMMMAKGGQEASLGNVASTAGTDVADIARRLNRETADLIEVTDAAARPRPTGPGGPAFHAIGSGIPPTTARAYLGVGLSSLPPAVLGRAGITLRQIADAVPGLARQEAQRLLVAHQLAQDSGDTGTAEQIAARIIALASGGGQ